MKKRIFRLIKNLIRNQRIKQLEGIPRKDLKQKHVDHLSMLLNRTDLLKQLPHHGVVAEIGVNKGAFSEDILKISTPSKLHLIDSWTSAEYHEGLMKEVNQKFAQEIEKGQVEINRGLSTEVGAQFDDGYFDWVYIDTNHTYSTTLEELRLYSKKVKPGGILTGHDFVRSNYLGTLRFGVVEALYEFCNAEDWELIFLTMENTINPSFAIRKISD